MVYVACMYTRNKDKPFYIGYSDNKKWVEEYIKTRKKIDKERDNESAAIYKVIQFSENMFYSRRKTDQDLYLASPLVEVSTEDGPMIICEDDLEIIDQTIYEYIEEFKMRVRDMIIIAKYFDDPSAKEFVKSAKTLCKKFEEDDEELHESFKMKRAIMKIPF